MRKLDEAIKLDIQQRVIEAADAYESCIDADPRLHPDAFINLTFLYWQSTEFGFSNGHGLPVSFIDHAADRYIEVHRQGRIEFPANEELDFWGTYFKWASLGQAFTVEKCERYITEPACVVPYFFVHSQPAGTRQPQLEAQLRRACASRPTTKNRYILSVLDSHAG